MGNPDSARFLFVNIEIGLLCLRFLYGKMFSTFTQVRHFNIKICCKGNFLLKMVMLGYSRRSDSRGFFS
jgi:hypothetical protein